MALIGFKGYMPSVLGDIPDSTTRIETIGEACHDFKIARSKLSVVNLRKELIANINLNMYNKSEHEISSLLHDEFNGDGILKAELRLSESGIVYPNPELLASHLFNDNNVNPLVFTIAESDLERFQGVLDDLKRKIAVKYRLNFGKMGAFQVTHDAYKRKGLLGNPFQSEIIYSAATICDSGKAGSKAEDLQNAMLDGNFILEESVVQGKSFWGRWAINTIVKNSMYNGAQLRIILNDLPEIILIIPKTLTMGPSVHDLSVMLDGVIMRKDTLSILQDMNKHLLIPEIRIFFNNFIENIRALYNQNPFDALKLILIFKEIGDMSQHMVAVKYKHLAGGSTDGLSTVAFLKRGVPISYIITDINGLDHIRFRVAGTLHIQGEISKEQFEEEIAVAKEKYSAKLKSIDAAKQAKKLLMRQRTVEILRRQQEEIEFERQLLIYKAAEIAKKRASSVYRSRGGSRRNINKRSKSNTIYKQKGGFSYNLIYKLINILFNYLYYILSLDVIPEECTLFNILDIPADDSLIDSYIDLTLLLINKDSYIFIDNNLLGLPLASILYILYEKLLIIDSALIQLNENSIIEDFLRGFNFTNNEIKFMLNLQALTPIQPKPPSGTIIRDITEADIEYFKLLVEKHDAKIPGFEVFKNESNNAYATNAENLPNPPRYQPIFQNIRKGKTEKKKTLIKSTPYYKSGSTPQKRPAYGYFQSMTGLTPRGIHVARKTRKRKNSTFKK